VTIFSSFLYCFWLYNCSYILYDWSIKKWRNVVI